MTEAQLEQLVVVLVLAVACTWLARLARVPAILPLLAAGIVVGPITGFVRPDQMLGEALFPAVSLAVALLLLEGGMSLRLRDLRDVGRPVLLLVSVGAAITFALTAGLLLRSDWLSGDVALIVASLLVVTGPTVVGPLLLGARPTRRVARTLVWEGIAIDPIGATLAIATLNAVTRHGNPIADLLLTVAVGLAAGLFGAALFIFVVRHRWLPADLEVAGALLLAVGGFAAAERVEPEAGLFAVTVMGLGLANQRRVRVQHIHEFQQQLSVLLIGVLFVLLGARVDLRALRGVLPAVLPLLAFLILLVRPVVVLLCTLRSQLAWRERIFVACVAPRGIVAAATASLFAMKLEALGRAPGPLVATVLVIVMATCLIYGLAAAPLAALLGIHAPRSKAVALVGTSGWLIGFAGELARLGAAVKLVTLGKSPEADCHARVMVVRPPLSERQEGDDGQDGDVALVLLAAEESDQNLLAAWHYGAAIGHDRLVVLAPEPELPPESAYADLVACSRVAFAGRISGAGVAAAVRAGGRFRTLEPPAGGLAAHDGVLLARVCRGGDVDLCPSRTGFRPGDRAVVLTVAAVDRFVRSPGR